MKSLKIMVALAAALVITACANAQADFGTDAKSSPVPTYPLGGCRAESKILPCRCNHHKAPIAHRSSSTMPTVVNNIKVEVPPTTAAKAATTTAPAVKIMPFNPNAYPTGSGEYTFSTDDNGATYLHASSGADYAWLMWAVGGLLLLCLLFALISRIAGNIGGQPTPAPAPQPAPQPAPAPAPAAQPAAAAAGQQPVVIHNYPAPAAQPAQQPVVVHNHYNAYAPAGAHDAAH